MERWVFDLVRQNADTIKAAPLAAVLILLAGVIAGYLFAAFLYKHRIESLTSRLALKDDRLKELEQRPTRAASPLLLAPQASSPVSDPPRRLPPSSRPPPEPVSEPERLFVSDEITLDHLIGLYKGHTTVQGEKLTRVYLGLWLRFEGPVHNVFEPYPGKRVVIFQAHDSEGRPEMDSRIIPTFDATKWGQRIDALGKGTSPG